MKTFISSLAASLIWTALLPAQSVWKFDLGSAQPVPGYIKVLPSTLYTPELGFGFEDGSGQSGKPPYYFSLHVPQEGNYEVTVTLGDAQSDSDTTVKAELRRLMLEAVRTPRGKFEKRTFIVNTRTPAISPGNEVRLKDREKTSEAWAWDNKLTLEFTGPHPAVSKIEIRMADNSIPTLYIAGIPPQPTSPANLTTAGDK